MTKAYYRGLTIGWDWAGSYASMGRVERRALVARLARMGTSDGQFVSGVWTGIQDRAEMRYDARRAGISCPVKTDRLAGVLERVA